MAEHTHVKTNRRVARNDDDATTLHKLDDTATHSSYSLHPNVRSLRIDIVFGTILDMFDVAVGSVGGIYMTQPFEHHSRINTTRQRVCFKIFSYVRNSNVPFSSLDHPNCKL